MFLAVTVFVSSLVCLCAENHLNVHLAIIALADLVPMFLAVALTKGDLQGTTSLNLKVVFADGHFIFAIIVVFVAIMSVLPITILAVSVLLVASIAISIAVLPVLVITFVIMTPELTLLQSVWQQPLHPVLLLRDRVQ